MASTSGAVSQSNLKTQKHHQGNKTLKAKVNLSVGSEQTVRQLNRCVFIYEMTLLLSLSARLQMPLKGHKRSFESCVLGYLQISVRLEF